MAIDVCSTHLEISAINPAFGFPTVSLWFFHTAGAVAPCQDGASLDLGLLSAAAQDPTEPLEVVECHAGHALEMENPWENHRETVGKPYGNHRKPYGDHRKMENHRKILKKIENNGKTIGKP